MSTISQLASAAQAAPTSTTTGSSAGTTDIAGSQEIAGNFNTFLQLLTTQLQNQDPLSPLDTNQFTEQLVEFASVEQQINENSNLQTLISLQQTSEATQAMQFLGSTVTVSSNAAALSNATGQEATWSLNSPSPATAAVTITSSTGQVAYTGTGSISSGTQSLCLERQRQQWRHVARRELHPVGHRNRSQWRRRSRSPRRCRARSVPSMSAKIRQRSWWEGRATRSVRSNRSPTAGSAISSANLCDRRQLRPLSTATRGPSRAMTTQNDPLGPSTPAKAANFAVCLGKF